MVRMVQTYRTPIIMAVFAIAGLAWWSQQIYQNIYKFGQEKQHQHLAGLFDIVEGAVYILWHNGSGADHTRQMLENIVSCSPLRFVILEKDGKRIVSTSNAPADRDIPDFKDERFEKTFFLARRKLDFKKDKTTAGHVVRDTVSAEDGAAGTRESGLTVIFGGELPQDDPAYSTALRGMSFTVAVSALFVIAVAVVWIMTIRNRLIAEQLKVDRARLVFLEDLGLAASGVVHETQNPLGIISGIAQQIARDPAEPEQSRARLARIIDEVDNAAARLGHFLAFARPRTIRMAGLDPCKVLGDLTGFLDSEFKAAGVRLETQCPAITILANEKILRQILVNLILNSLNASFQGGKVRVEITCSGKHAALTVRDQGRGIAPDLLPDIFKPYVTGTPDGHGLGLAIVKRYVEDQGWTIAADSEVNRGTRVTIGNIGLVKKKGEKGD